MKENEKNHGDNNTNKEKNESEKSFHLSSDNLDDYKHLPKRGKGRGRGHHGRHGRGPRRGRPPVSFPIPLDISRFEKGQIRMTSFELKILEMSDIEGMNQTKIAEILEISQTSVWRYLNSIRKRIAKAMTQYKHIEIIVTN